jgi:hypothetical protein
MPPSPEPNPAVQSKIHQPSVIKIDWDDEVLAKTALTHAVLTK